MIAGANASHYVADGLYAMDTYVVANGEYVYVLTGAYISKDSAIYKDFQILLSTFQFIPSAN